MNAITSRSSLSFIVVSLAILGLISGCSSAPMNTDDTQPQDNQPNQPNQTENPEELIDDSEFWRVFQVKAQEANPPHSLEELTNRADLITTGKVLSIEKGPVDQSDDKVGPSIETVALVIQTSDVIKGTLTDKDVKIVIIPFGPIDLATHAKPSGRQAMFFLVQRSDGYYACVSLAGIVEDTPDGLVTVTDPVQSELVAISDDTLLKTFSDLVSEVRFLAK